MEVNYKLFGILRTQAENAEGTLTIPENSTVASLMVAIEKIEPAVSFQKVTVNVAVNQTLVSGDDALSEGDEVSFVPPLAGG